MLLSTPLSSRPSLVSCSHPGHRWCHALLQAIVGVMLSSWPSLVSCSHPGHRWCHAVLQAIVGVMFSSRPSLVSCSPPGHRWCHALLQAIVGVMFKALGLQVVAPALQHFRDYHIQDTYNARLPASPSAGSLSPHKHVFVETNTCLSRQKI